MTIIETIEDEAGRVLCELTWGHLTYVLGNGTQIPVNKATAWCRNCNRFVLAEVLQHPDEMEQDAREYCEWVTTEDPVHFDPATARKLLEMGLERAAHWRVVMTTRRSPPRCLQCGSFGFKLLSRKCGWLAHPGKPGRFVQSNLECSESTTAVEIMYDTEGLRIVAGNAELS